MMAEQNIEINLGIINYHIKVIKLILAVFIVAK
jgi:hypothetical protein